MNQMIKLVAIVFSCFFSWKTLSRVVMALLGVGAICGVAQAQQTQKWAFADPGHQQCRLDVGPAGICWYDKTSGTISGRQGMGPDPLYERGEEVRICRIYIQCGSQSLQVSSPGVGHVEPTPYQGPPQWVTVRRLIMNMSPEVFVANGEQFKVTYNVTSPPATNSAVVVVAGMAAGAQQQAGQAWNAWQQQLPRQEHADWRLRQVEKRLGEHPVELGLGGSFISLDSTPGGKNRIGVYLNAGWTPSLTEDNMLQLAVGAFGFYKVGQQMAEDFPNVFDVNKPQDVKFLGGGGYVGLNANLTSWFTLRPTAYIGALNQSAPSAAPSQTGGAVVTLPSTNVTTWLFGLGADVLFKPGTEHLALGPGLLWTTTGKDLAPELRGPNESTARASTVEFVLKLVIIP